MNKYRLEKSMEEKLLRNLANSNMNASGVVVKAGEDSEKKRILTSVVPKKDRIAHESRLIHMHDLEFYDTTYNCIGVNVSKLIGDEEMNFKTAIRRLNRAIISLTNAQAGGIGFLDFDNDMALYVREESIEELSSELRELYMDLNTYCRKGCEKAYVTFNFGLGYSNEARKVGFAMLKAYESGDEYGKPFIFPNLVFKMKNSINVASGTENHTLYLAALATTSRRMIPTYFNCNSSSNGHADSTKIGIMGCRTRVVDNLYGEKSGLNRGNIACVTINLVQIAYQSKCNMELFLNSLRNVMNYAKDSLIHRYRVLLENADLSEVYRLNIYKDIESKNAELIFRNGTLSIGFIGLWDALSVVFSKEWNDIEEMGEYLEDAFHIVRFMRTMTDDFTKESGLNFSLLASAAEGVTGNFAKYDYMNKGKGMAVAEKGYYTNSFHIPVSIKTDFVEKIEFEGKFHHLCNGGSITYIELEEMPVGNVEGVREIVEYAYNHDCNYIGVNFPLDNCCDCDYVGRISQTCPICESLNVRRLRRVSGYLAEEDKFVCGKKLELMDRISHNKLPAI